MAYPLLPGTLAALSGSLATPADSELASAWPAVDRQTRNWIYDFLTTYFDPTTNQLKPSAIGGGTVPGGSVSGTNPQSGNQGQVVQGSIQFQDLATGCVTTSKIANAAITQAQLAAGCVGTAQLQDSSVTATKLAPASIPGSAITPNSLTSVVFGSQCVTNAALGLGVVQNPNIGSRAVDGSMLPACAPGQILVGGGTINSTPNSLIPATLSGAISIDATGKATFNVAGGSTVLSFARVAEVGTPGTACGKSNSGTAFNGHLTSSTGYNSTGTPWNGRGLGQGAGGEANTAWQIVNDPSKLLTVNDTILNTPVIVAGTSYMTYQHPIYVNQQCTLLITASIPGYEQATHRMRLVTLADPSQPQNFQQYWGTSEASKASSAVQTRSSLSVLVTFAGPANGLNLPYFYIDWFAGTADAAGLGIASGLGGNEYYGDVTVIRLA